MSKYIIVFLFIVSIFTPKISQATVAKAKPRVSIDSYSSFIYDQKVTIGKTSFSYDRLDIRLDDPKLRIMTATADTASCKVNCHAKPLLDYVKADKAFAGINGSYFCSGSGCGVHNYYYFPVLLTPP